jgi:hypothetical protein
MREVFRLDAMQSRVLFAAPLTGWPALNWTPPGGQLLRIRHSHISGSPDSCRRTGVVPSHRVQELGHEPDRDNDRDLQPGVVVDRRGGGCPLCHVSAHHHHKRYRTEHPQDR